MAKKSKIEIPLYLDNGQFNQLYIIPHGGMTDEILHFIVTSGGGNEYYDTENMEFSISFQNWHNLRTIDKKGVSSIHNYITKVKRFAAEKISESKFIDCLNLAASNGWIEINTTWDCYRNIIIGTQQQPPQQPTQKSGNTNNINNLFSSI
jgi:hypothetical protein